MTGDTPRAGMAGISNMRLSILQGDVFERMSDIPDNTIDLCITSPPYWGLRSYGAGEAELGREPSMEKYLDNTLGWVKEVYRVLKPSGSFVLNIGDCFCGSWGGGYDRDKDKRQRDQETQPYGVTGLKHPERTANYYAAKNLLSVSSFAYCRIVSETDFVCRGEHIWAKPNVPSPIRSRLKHSHEKLFWFVKDADRYYFDEKAWMKKINLKKPQFRKVGERQLISADALRLGSNSCFRPKDRNPTANSGVLDQSTTPGKRGCGMENTETIEHSWRVVPVGAKQNGFEMEDGKPQSEHVAPFPEGLIRPYIRSLCPAGGIVLDPFLGSGTTMRVTMEEHRDCIGIELNEKSIQYAKKRLNWGLGLGVAYS